MMWKDLEISGIPLTPGVMKMFLPHTPGFGLSAIPGTPYPLRKIKSTNIRKNLDSPGVCGALFPFVTPGWWLLTYVTDPGGRGVLSGEYGKESTTVRAICGTG